MKHYRYAHRGLHDLSSGAPENSLAAFRRAAEAGFPSELDVHLCADGTLAVFHDSDLRRMTGYEGVIEDLTREQYGALALAGTAETIPAFEDVLSVYEGRGLPLLVELKSRGNNFSALAARAAETLDRFRVPYCMESFDPRCLTWLRRNRPEILRGQLAQDFRREPTGMGRGMDVLLTNLCFDFSTRPDFIAYNYDDRRSLTLRLRARLHGMALFYWTVRSRAELEEAEREGAQPIFEHFLPEGPDIYP